MSDHEFEKKVQHKLDELKFTPSEAVWSRVEADLRGEKTRRRGWFWVPVMLGILAAGGYLLRSGLNVVDNSAKAGSEKQVAQHSTVDPKPGKKNKDVSAGNSAIKNAETDGVTLNENNPAIATDQNTSNTNGTEPRHQNNEVKPDPNKTIAARNNKSAIGESITPGTSRPGNHVNKTGHSTEQQNTRQSYPESGDASVTNNRGTKLPGAGEKSGTDDNGSRQSSANTGRTGITAEQAFRRPVDLEKDSVHQHDIPAAVVTNTIDSVQNIAVNNQPDSSVAVHTNDVQAITTFDKETPVPQDSVLNAPIQLKGLSKSRKWQFGLSFSAGVSKLSEGSLTDLLKNANVADAASMERQASNNFLFLPTTAGVPRPKPSPVKPGFALSIGAYAGRQLTRRLSLTIGLGYMQYNNFIQIGYRVDSSMLVNNVNQVANVSRYYRADQKSKYTNRYHFIELPLQFQARINKGVKTPLTWNAGVTLAQLFASRALLFDSGTGVYYEDNTRYNRTQFAINTGFSIGVFTRSKFPMIIGPSVRYHATPLYRENIGGKKHLLSASLDLRLPLIKK